MLINKSMDRDDLAAPGAQAIVDELNRLVHWLRERDLGASSWYGTLDLPDEPDSMERVNRGHGYRPLDGAADDRFHPWFLYWEIAWLTLHNEYRPGERIVDLGGCSSLFSLYLASKGMEVWALELNEELVAHGDRVAEVTGWNLHNLCMDIAKPDLPGTFDHAASVCVFEHLPVSGRIQTSARIRDLLRDGGSFSLTFDYRNPSRLARIDSPADVEEQFVRPSGLAVRGNREFHDNGKRYLLHPFHHPRATEEDWAERCVSRGQFDASEVGTVRDENEYTFGALFLERAPAAA